MNDETLKLRIQKFFEAIVVAIIRTHDESMVVPAAKALAAGDIRILEITLTVPHALDCIREVRERLAPSVLVGAGTVLSRENCASALDAGAEFVVTPIFRPEIVAEAHDRGCPVMMGAYTPTEAQAAFEAGADFIKLFPADRLGPAYIKALLGPLPHLQIVPTGGVNLETIGDFLKAGCAAVGVGSSLLSPKLLVDRDWHGLEALARSYVQSVASWATSRTA